MQRFILRRILWNIPVLILITVVTFGMMQIVPGGPFTAGSSGRPIPPEIRANMMAKYGLDKPVWQQYLNYMGRLILHFDFGPSLRRPGRTVNQMLFGGNFLVDVLREHLRDEFGTAASSMTFAEPPSIFDSKALVVKTNGEPVAYIYITWRDRFEAVKRFLTLAPVMVSAQVGLVSVTLALLIGIPLGIISALKQNTWIDYVAMFISMLGVSIPNFILGIVLILVFALWLGWLPTYGWGESWKQVIMPAITLGTGGMAFIARLTRASMLEVIRADYIRTARAKGLAERVVVLRHALKNSLIPVTTVLGPMMAAWLTGSFLVEWVFSIGGIGKFFVSAVTDRDYTLIMGTILIYSVALVLFNLAVDIAYGFIDPRIRFD
ncbi:MAG TPA: ABC transporter permease [Thermoflexia bacterium]|jgi:ABC-type dipeptide/oligopeptide/nickel transport system permease component|nr:ABC transporter permease [Thermoflexia bacterium]